MAEPTHTTTRAAWCVTAFSTFRATYLLRKSKRWAAVRPDSQSPVIDSNCPDIARTAFPRAAQRPPQRSPTAKRLSRLRSTKRMRRGLGKGIAGFGIVLSVALPLSLGAQDIAQLRTSLVAAFGSADLPGATWGTLVVSLDTGDTLFSIAPSAPLTPASNVKLLTTAAALQRLGPNYRFRTYLLSDGVVEDGVLKGDLVLYGTGDPGISDRFYGSKDEVFQRLTDELELAGIRKIEGDLVADASFFPGPLRDDGWDPTDLNEHFTAGVSALSYNENVVSFRIRPGPVGSPPRVETVPPHSALAVSNTARTVEGRARARLAILREDPLAPVRVVGTVTRSARDVWRQMTVAVPAEFAGASFRAVAEERGIVVTGETRVVGKPGESVLGRLAAPALGKPGARLLATHVSRPLRDYLEVTNKESNNLFAELLFRSLGRVSSGIGSPEASSAAVRTTLHSIGVDTTGLVQVDGSGLAEGNQVSAGAFVQIIAGMNTSPLWPDFWASLPQAGTRRELGRMYRTAAAGNLRAKTGTIEGVSALSGMVRSKDGERLAFSILVNDSPSQTRAKRVENLIGARLASFQRTAGSVPEIAAKTTLPQPLASSSDRHRIARGENLTSIANQYGVSIKDILRVNPRVDRNRIVAGQWIEIPVGGAGSF
jgi:D-alanyl-D-alanine carboxypeptidase/D-alanyl-D-alanine-endopeptidase (penicillin-binding protein 4)